MSESVSDFQAQVASLMDLLLKTAVKEITKLFEERYNAGRCIAQTETETVEKPKQISLAAVRNHLESSLKSSRGKALCSVGVQVGKEWTPVQTEAPPLLLPCPLAQTRGSSRQEAPQEDAGASPEEMEGLTTSGSNHGRKEEALGSVDLHCTVDLPCTALKDRDGDIAASKSSIMSGKPQPEQSSVSDAPKEFGNVFNYLRKTLGWSDSHQAPDSPEPPVLEKEVLTETDENPTAAAVTYDDSLPDTPTSLSLSTSTCTSQYDQSLASSGSLSDPDPEPNPDPATPVQVGVQALSALPEAMRFQLGVEPRDWKLLQPCAVQLVDLHLLTGPSRGRLFPRGSPRPKDLRPHQGLHTGRRLCCFSECGGGVWRVVGSVKTKAKTKMKTKTASGVGSPGGSLACKFCGKTFARRKLLRRHERFHAGEQPYVCHLCRKRFTLRKSLRRHLRFHTGEKPHGCPHCSKSFRLKDSLKAHLRFHTGERPFACTLCPKSFRLQKNLEVHTATH